MNLEKYVVEVDATIQEAIRKIENNHKGFILIQDISSRIIGIATDGDIRRKLLENIKLNDSILNCINKNFISARPDNTR